MNSIKAKELKNLSLAELAEKKAGFEKELRECLQKKINGQLDKPHLFKVFRRQIACVNTIEREKKNAG